MRYKRPEPDYPPFAALPARLINGFVPGEGLAVHVSGRFTPDKPPLVCLAGFHRNMTDYTDFLRVYRNHASLDWPIVLVDLAGRGRSGYRGRAEAYSATTDAHDLISVLRALGIHHSIFVGQGHGGQVVMALGAQHPSMIAGAVLINSGPTTNPQGLVRARANLTYLATLRGAAQVETALTQVLAADYPDLPQAHLAALGARTHFVDKRGQAHGLFDPALVQFLDRFNHDDAFEPQWQLFDALAAVPLLLLRSDLTDRLGDNTFAEMCARRPDAQTAIIKGQASPALLDSATDIEIIAEFVSSLTASKRR